MEMLQSSLEIFSVKVVTGSSGASSHLSLHSIPRLLRQPLPSRMTLRHKESSEKEKG